MPASLSETPAQPAALFPEDLRVGVDARAGSQYGGGVATYGGVLMHALRAHGVQVEAVTDGSTPVSGLAALPRRWLAASAAGARPLTLGKTPSGPAWERRDLFREAQVHFNLYGRLLPVRCSQPPALMHWTYPVPLVMRGVRNIYTIHDVIPLEHPDLTPISSGRHARLLNEIARVADQLVTVSDHSRAALTAALPRFAGPIVNTYQAVIAPPAPRDAALPRGLTPGEYLLFCGSADPRKNIDGLIAAHAHSEVSLPLVIVGPVDGRTKPAGPSTSTGRVIRLNWVERPVLLALMQHARALLFPSLAEGFGLPVVEAMALGTPVMTSNRGALAEIAGDAALTVQPDDVAALARAIVALTNDPELRENLRRAGRIQARRFSLEAYAARLADAYARRLERPVPPPV